MNYIIFFAILFVFQFSSCKAQDLSISSFVSTELYWKKHWVELFFNEYRNYQVNRLDYCGNSNRDVVYDIERKMRAINQIPLGLTLKDLQAFIAANSVEYDSLIMVNVHSPLYEEEFNFAPVYFYFFNEKGKRLIIAHFNDDRELTFEEYQGEVEWTKEKEKLSNGCGYGFITYTLFGKDLEGWKITKIVINPDE